MCGLLSQIVRDSYKDIILLLILLYFPVGGRESHQFTTRFEGNIGSNLNNIEPMVNGVGGGDDDQGFASPAVLRSLKNIRREREVVVDIEGRNVIR